MDGKRGREKESEGKKDMERNMVTEARNGGEIGVRKVGKV